MTTNKYTHENPATLEYFSQRQLRKYNRFAKHAIIADDCNRRTGVSVVVDEGVKPSFVGRKISPMGLYVLAQYGEGHLGR
jgi:hypothetical protein